MRFLGTLMLFTALTLSACGNDSQCNAQSHCHHVDGVATCDSGYDWQDPDDPENYQCVAIDNAAPSHGSTGSPTEPPPTPVWSQVSDVYYGILGVWSNGTNQMVAVGMSGSLYHQYGSDFYSFSTSLGSMSSVWANAADNIWAADDDGDFLHFDGFEWTIHREDLGQINDIWGVGDELWAVGNLWRIARYYDGEDWSYDSLPDSDNVYGIHGTSRNNIWAVGSGGYVAHFDGETWTQQSSPTESALLDVWVAPNGDVWVVGQYAQIYRYNGSYWASYDNPYQPTFATLQAVHGTSSQNIWFVGNDAMLLKWNGYSFQTFEDVENTDFVSVWVNSATDVYVGGHDPFGFGAGSLHHYGVPEN